MPYLSMPSRNYPSKEPPSCKGIYTSGSYLHLRTVWNTQVRLLYPIFFYLYHCNPHSMLSLLPPNSFNIAFSFNAFSPSKVDLVHFYDFTLLPPLSLCQKLLFSIYTRWAIFLCRCWVWGLELHSHVHEHSGVQQCLTAVSTGSTAP